MTVTINTVDGKSWPLELEKEEFLMDLMRKIDGKSSFQITRNGITPDVLIIPHNVTSVTVSK